MASALRELRGERMGRHTAETVRGDCQEARSTGCCVAWRPRQVVAGEDFLDGSSGLKNRKRLARQAVVGRMHQAERVMCGFQEVK